MKPSIPSFFSLPRSPHLLHLAIGVFDGVHRGHQKVITSACELSESKSNTTLLSFFPHPLSIISPYSAPQKIVSLEEKIALAKEYGIHTVIIARFDHDLKKLTPREFVQHLLRIFPKLRSISVGENWRFGAGGRGRFETLAELTEVYNFAAYGVEAECDGEEVISSTKIRKAIREGDIQKAEKMLGHSYSIQGSIGSGMGRGKTLGFPTANLKNLDQVLPPHGTYACLARVGEKTYPSVMNFGSRPTFENTQSSVHQEMEVHLLDFQGDIYEETIRLSDLKFLRKEKKFSSEDLLKKQIKEDIQKTKELLQYLP